MTNNQQQKAVPASPSTSYDVASNAVVTPTTKKKNYFILGLAILMCILFYVGTMAKLSNFHPS